MSKQRRRRLNRNKRTRSRRSFIRNGVEQLENRTLPGGFLDLLAGAAITAAFDLLPAEEFTPEETESESESITTRAGSSNALLPSLSLPDLDREPLEVRAELTTDGEDRDIAPASLANTNLLVSASFVDSFFTSNQFVDTSPHRFVSPSPPLSNPSPSFNSPISQLGSGVGSGSGQAYNVTGAELPNTSVASAPTSAPSIPLWMFAEGEGGASGGGSGAGTATGTASGSGSGGGGGGASGTGSNSPPTANDGYVYTIHDQVTTGTFSGQDWDYDLLSISVSSSSLGSLSLSSPYQSPWDSSTTLVDYTFTPNSGATGSETLTLTVSDGEYSDDASVSVSVWNSVPEPSDDWAYTIHDQDATGNVAWNDGLMQNGSNWQDYDGDTVTFVLVDDVSDGTLTLDSATGDFTYEPSTGFVGDDLFTYQLSDGLGTSTYTATVEIYVSNSIPEPSDDWAYTTHDQDATGNVAWNDGLMQNGSNWQDYDGDTVTFVLVDDVSDGTLMLDSATGDFTYEPSTGFVGDDLFTYQLSDGLGTSTYIATVFIAVVNNVPEPSDDGPFMVQCHCDDATGNVADNDGLTADGDNWKDGDGDAVTFVLVDNVSNGTLDFDTATGEFKYEQNEGYIGNDSFTYKITDGLGTSTTKATVSLSVVGGTVPATPPSIQGTLTVDGNATSSAAKGTLPSGVTTTDAELIYWKYYYMQYDGPTEFTVEYTVNLKTDGSFDPTDSTAKMKGKNYTVRKLVVRDSLTPDQKTALEADGAKIYEEGGKFYILKKADLKEEGWDTVSIPITSATLVNGRLHSFTLKGDKWYSNPPAGMVDKGIEGSVDLAKCKVEFTAKYQEPINGSIATYVTKGKIKN